MTIRFRNAARLGRIREFAVAKIPIQKVGGEVETTWSTFDRHALPDAIHPVARFWSGFQVELDVVGHKEIQFAIAVIVDESAARAPLSSVSGNTGLLRDFFEAAVVLVMVEAILP